MPQRKNSTRSRKRKGWAKRLAYTPDNSVVESVAYSYDAGGQRITKTQGQASPGETPLSATYDEANRLTAITLNGEPFTLSYDENGNLASKSGATLGATSYTWSARNQLVSISGPSGTASFKYDALGRRIEKTVNGDTTGFLYDGPQAIAELKGSALEIVYHTGLEIDEVLTRYGASGNKALLGDALMSAIAQANDDQSMSNFYVYSPYGESITLGADDGNAIQYTGRENDGTGLYFYRARYYDPVLKRFIQEDPIGLQGGVNVYAFVNGNPIRFRDPLGLDPNGRGGNSSSAACGTDYGTQDCSYYAQRCQQSGGRDIYYCTLAPAVCNVTRPIGMDCVRQCLQDADKKVCTTPDGKVDPWCTTGAHLDCWTQCTINSSRPSPTLPQ